MPALRILHPGQQTTVQDLGRHAHTAIGVSTSGHADPLSAAVANHLVSNDPAAALLEITLTGPTIRFDEPATIAITGSPIDAAIDDHPIDLWRAHRIKPGQTLRLGATATGARACLAIAGGINTPPVLASRSTHIASGLGGHQGRPLRAGDTLELTGAPQPQRLPALTDTQRSQLAAILERRTLRITAGPHSGLFNTDALRALESAPYTVTDRSDRMGLRLDGTPLTSTSSGDLPSEPTPPGAIQVPPGARPIILGPDRPTTGGYPMIACIISADLPALGQSRPRDILRFRLVTLDDARAAWREQHGLIQSIVNTR